MALPHLCTPSSGRMQPGRSYWGERKEARGLDEGNTPVENMKAEEHKMKCTMKKGWETDWKEKAGRERMCIVYLPPARLFKVSSFNFHNNVEKKVLLPPFLQIRKLSLTMLMWFAHLGWDSNPDSLCYIATNKKPVGLQSRLQSVRWERKNKICY